MTKIPSSLFSPYNYSQLLSTHEPTRQALVIIPSQLGLGSSTVSSSQKNSSSLVFAVTTMTAASFPSVDSQDGPSTSNRPLGRTSGLWMMITFTVAVAFAVAVALAVTVGSIAGRSSLAIQPLTKNEGTSSSPVAAHQNSSRLAQDATCPLRDVGARCRRSSGCCSQNCVGAGWRRFCEAPPASTLTPPPPILPSNPTPTSPTTVIVSNPTPTSPVTVIVSNPDATLPFQANFDTDASGFAFAADTFRGTRNARRVSGLLRTNGVLEVNLGRGSNANNNNAGGVSGGYRLTFVLDQDANVSVEFRFRIKTSPSSGTADVAQAMASVDDTLIGQAPFDVVGQVVGNFDSSWKLFRVTTGRLTAGRHTLTLGGYCSSVDSPTRVRFDDVQLKIVDETADEGVVDPKVDVHTVVDRLDLQPFKDNIERLASFGDRLQGTNSYARAATWVESELNAVGYTVQRDGYQFRGEARDNLYVTKVGKSFPDRMFIVSAHLDGRGGGGAADDDGSGCSLVLEIAKLFASTDVETDVSVRMVFWNNEESGLNGSSAYANDRLQDQGQESPAGSGIFPEPTWLGVLQHDMILYDHGLPPSGQQIPGADADIEYRSDSVFADQSRLLANALLAGNQEYGEFYPAQVGSRMSSTDSVSFQNVSPAVSLRENQRLAEIGNGAQPNWHQRSDLFATYSEADYIFGFNIVQTTMGTVAELAGLTLKVD